MAQNRKLQAEIERTLKRVGEGLSEFEEIWQRVYSAPTATLKEKHEADLKKEIKKLQRYRDQIKTWLGSSEIRDKDDLLTARKQIERDMERFKVCEKETKTKAFSKEALNNTPKKKLLDKPKLEIKDWIDSRVSKLRSQLEERLSQLDREQRRGKKRNKQQDGDHIEDLQRLVEKYKFHIEHLEMAWEMLFEDEIQISDFNEVQDDVDFFVENNQEEEMQNFDDSYIYDLLIQRRGQKPKVEIPPPQFESELDNTDSGIDAGNQTGAGDRKDDIQTGKSRKKSASTSLDRSAGSKAESKDRSSKKESKSSKKDKSSRKEKVVSPASLIQVSSNYGPASSKTSKSNEVSPSANASMKSSRLSLSSVDGGTPHTAFANVVKQQKQAEQKAKAVVAAKSKAASSKKQQNLAHPAQGAVESSAKKIAEAIPKSPAAVPPTSAAESVDSASAGDGAISSTVATVQSPSASSTENRDIRIVPERHVEVEEFAGQSDSLIRSRTLSRDDSPLEAQSSSCSFGSQLSDEQVAKLDLLGSSLRHMPGAVDSERPKQYLPRNPYNTPVHFPSSPSAIFEDPSFFEKYDTDTLFFIFYFQQGTYQQYLAARQLKKQSWRYHTKYLTWFQRHEDPQVTTDEHEQGTYVYFDYDHSWCQRIKAEFTFEYRFLEDELV